MALVIFLLRRKVKNEVGIVIELKYSKNEKSLDKDCQDALQQIEDRNYGQELCNQGYQKILKYGIAFYHKKCCVKVAMQSTND